MNYLQVFLWFMASFLLGILLGTAAVETYEKSSFRPWEWKYPPIIVNCYGKDMNELHIVQAVHYWTLKGHNVSYIEQNPTDTLCQADHIHGFIMIKKKNLPYGTLGETRRYVYMLNIVSAVIYFDAGTYRITNVFEHEMGHALGYNHVEEEGHIMHPIWDKMTNRFWIPE
tara:strand:- start:6573 stop:7082 length:510 start_codon:yes stop_codon:yes gene_type:complete